MSDLRILAIPGSLRKASFNRGLLVAAQEMLSGRAEVEIVSLTDIPLYNDDVRALGYPEPVESLRSAIERADALLIGATEYNFGPSGVLKNAIDWASRPPGPPLLGKPYGLVGASIGGFGTVRAQLQLRQNLLFVQALGNPGSLHVSGAAALFDENGKLTDEATRQSLGDFLDGFLAFLERTGAGN
ncbi:MAG TPA: NADPH-dependent FMN reductase [Gaiellaceae bacterium]